ncbi:MAG: hypothetical protein OXC92_08610 [Flavobacteriaceae bacterium]|nr:hypothetical protein [Flavobacteriaceae bacterium]MCY4217027.1 hypothetical protein [Flavobacteriaceae bacterium]MCY4253674.1 hypothetical protein [Flavobacteriaceae bacterium]
MIEELITTFQHIDFKTVENVEKMINGVIQKMIESNEFSNGAKSIIDDHQLNWN